MHHVDRKVLNWNKLVLVYRISLSASKLVFLSLLWLIRILLLFHDDSGYLDLQHLALYEFHIFLDLSKMFII